MKPHPRCQPESMSDANALRRLANVITNSIQDAEEAPPIARAEEEMMVGEGGAPVGTRATRQKTVLIVWLNTMYPQTIFEHVLHGLGKVIQEFRTSLRGDRDEGGEELIVRTEVCFGNHSFANCMPNVSVHSPSTARLSIVSTMDAIREAVKDPSASELRPQRAHVVVLMLTDGNIAGLNTSDRPSCAQISQWRKWLASESGVMEKSMQFVLLSMGGRPGYPDEVRDRIMPYFTHPEPPRLDWHVPIIPFGPPSGRSGHVLWPYRLMSALLPPKVESLTLVLSSVPHWARADYVVRPVFPDTYGACMEQTRALFDGAIAQMACPEASLDTEECLAKLGRVGRYLKHLMDMSVHPMCMPPRFAQSYGELLSDVLTELIQTVHAHPPSEPFCSAAVFAEYVGYAEKLSRNLALIRSNTWTRPHDWYDSLATLLDTWPKGVPAAGEEGKEGEEGDEEGRGCACIITGTDEREIRDAIQKAVLSSSVESINMRFQYANALLMSELGPLHTFAAVSRKDYSCMIRFTAFALRIAEVPPSIQCIASSQVRRAANSVEKELLARTRLCNEWGARLRDNEAGLEAMRQKYLVVALPYTSDPDLYASPLYTFLCSDALMRHMDARSFTLIPHAPLGITAARAVFYLKQGAFPDFVRREVQAAVAAFADNASGTLATEVWWWRTYLKRVQDDGAFRTAIGFAQTPSTNMHNPSQLVLAMLMLMVPPTSKEARAHSPWSAERIALRAAAVLVWFMMRTRGPHLILTHWCDQLLAARRPKWEDAGYGDGPFAAVGALCAKYDGEIEDFAEFRRAVMAEFDSENMAEAILAQLRPNPLAKPRPIRFESVRDGDQNPVFLFKGWNVTTLQRVFRNMSLKMGHGELPPIDPLAAALYATDFTFRGVKPNAPFTTAPVAAVGRGVRMPTHEDLAEPNEALFDKYWIHCNVKRVRAFVMKSIVVKTPRRAGAGVAAAPPCADGK